MTRARFAALPRLFALGLAVLLLAGCSMGGSGGGLAPGLTARMDQPGASLDRAQALAIINHYRTSTGGTALVADAGLDTSAQSLATQYAGTGRQPPRPAGAVEVRYSAGYFTFAETFSGWRNSKADAAALLTPGATRAGLAAIYSENSPYGTYWVLILG